MAVAPDGEEIVTGGDDGAVRIWNRRSGEERLVLRGHGGAVQSVAVAPDGEEIVTGGDDGAVRIWNRRSGQERLVMRAHRGGVRSVTVTPEGVEIVTGGNDSTARVWNRRSGQERLVLRVHRGRVWSVAMSSEGEEIITGGSDGTARIWNRRSGRLRWVLRGHRDTVRSVAIAPDGDEIATASNDGSVRVWTRGSDKERMVLQGHGGAVLAVAIAPEGEEIVSGGGDGTVRVWSSRSGKERLALAGHRGRVWSVAMTPDDEEIVTGGGDGTARVWNRLSGKEGLVLRGHHGSVWSVAVTPSGEEIVTGGDDGTARIWNRRSGDERLVLQSHSGSVWCVATTPDGEEIVAGGSNGIAWVWDRHSGEQRLILRGHGGAVRRVAVTPDGEEIVMGGTDGTAWVWDRHSGEQRLILRGHGGTVWSVAATPDGEEIVTGSEDGTARVWNRRSGKERLVLRGKSGSVSSVAVTPDGEEIVTGSEDGTVRIWNRRSGEERLVLRGHRGSVWTVVVAYDGGEIVTGGSDGTTRIWNRSSGRQVRGTDLGGAGASRPLAGLRSDEPSDVDLLNIGAEVEMMVNLVAAASTQAPLAVALLGDWGSGKSSFMRQMETQIRELAEASANNVGQSEFMANVCQVRFNAWHYSDDQIWSGLVEHLFRALASEVGDGPPDPIMDPGNAAEVREQLQEATTEYEQVNRDLNQLASKPRPVGRLVSLGSAGELLALPGILFREVWRDVRSSSRALLGWLGAVVGLVAAMAALLWVRGFVLRVVLALASVGAAAARVWRPLKKMHAWLLDSAGRQRQRLEKRRDEAHRRIAVLRSELALVSASERLHRFVADRRGASDYTPYRGLLGLVYRDLRELNESLKAALQEWESLSPPRPKPPLQRIVLYIDDLDRCPPQRVVEVLQAVHLLLALPLFVVVVAVDVRWLELSLRHHFAELLGHGDVSQGILQSADPIVTPWDYLEKIFQITYGLRPMGPQAAAYLEALLPSESETPGATALSVQADLDSISPQPDAADVAPSDHAGGPESSGEMGTAPSAIFLSEDLKGEATGDGRGPSSPLHRRSALASVRNLQPEGLRMRARERAFIPALAPLLPTPRAAKRLINIYRLIRIGIPDDDLEDFVGDETGGPYQALGVLVAIVVGHPELAHAVLSELPATMVPDFFALLGQLQSTAGTAAESESWTRLLHQLDELRKIHENLMSETAEFRKWASTVARFSLHTRDLVDSTGS